MLQGSFKKEVSVLSAVILSCSIMLPTLAAAAPSVNATYDKSTGTVTASVYTDVYDSTYGSVSLDVYAPDGKTLLNTVSKATYDGYGQDSVTGATYWYYQMSSSVTANTYDYLRLTPSYHNVSGSVYCSVYNGPNQCPSTAGTGNGSGIGGGFGGGIGGIGLPQGDTLNANADGSVDATSLSTALKNGSHVTVTITGDYALLPASALQDANSEDIITVTNGKDSYDLPVGALKLQDLASQLGITVNDLSIRVTVKVLGSDAAKPIQDAVKAVAGSAAVADIVDYQVEAVGKDGKSNAIDFGKLYLSRSMGLTKAVDPKRATGVVFNPDTGKISFVPSIFSADDQTAVIKRNGNSIYTVIEGNGLSFSDIASHWAKSDIELLANKLVVDGETDTTFEPEWNITRAEFAALAVRALGLSVGTGSGQSFSDVASSAWYSGVVDAAAKAGLVDGYEDGTFRPDQPITREELAALMVRALTYAGTTTSLTSSEQSTLLAKFTDANRIVWGQTEMAEALKAGLVNGMTDTTLATYQNATRAQAAVMLERLLQKANFIN